MKPGDKIDKYTLLCPIGRGGFGQVFLAERNDGKHVAFKVVSLIGETGDRELQAIESYKKCPKCEALLDIYDIVIQNDDDRFYYTMELADNLLGEESRDYVPATLAEVLRRDKKLSLLQTTELIIQLLEGLDVIHSNKLVHRDIKPANIIWVNGRAKLSDIGLMANNLSLTYRAGSDGFLPPRGSCIPKNSTTIDLYALTRVIYCCLSGKTVNEYPDMDWIETKDEQEERIAGELQRLMLKTDEQLVKMDVSDFQRQLQEATLKATHTGASFACTSCIGTSFSRTAGSMIESKIMTDNGAKDDSLLSLPSLSKIASAESWIHKQKLTKKDFLKAASVIGATTVLGSPMSLVATVGTIALLAGGGILLSKIAHK